MGVLAFLCPATGKSVFTDLEINRSIYSSILKNRLSHMHCSECGEPFPRWSPGLPKFPTRRQKPREAS